MVCKAVADFVFCVCEVVTVSQVCLVSQQFSAERGKGDVFGNNHKLLKEVGANVPKGDTVSAAHDYHRCGHPYIKFVIQKSSNRRCVVSSSVEKVSATQDDTN